MRFVAGYVERGYGVKGSSRASKNFGSDAVWGRYLSTMSTLIYLGATIPEVRGSPSHLVQMVTSDEC